MLLYIIIILGVISMFSRILIIRRSYKAYKNIETVTKRLGFFNYFKLYKDYRNHIISSRDFCFLILLIITMYIMSFIIVIIIMGYILGYWNLFPS